ncbi:MAG TPA: Rieske (2Fe-2S) protein [Planctomycetes bacterium]|nr:Rieske (2Fe-2S) protein [Fuerstiella sp.]HIK95866.1 Rieske (2Fe-2S) protein [Planctomycetota bacterium]
MSEFQTVANVNDIPEGQGRCFPVNGTMVGVFLHQGEYFAINDFCPHMGASLSESPIAEDGSVMCSWHAWCFSIKDGTWLDNSKSGIKTPTYDVRLQGNEIQVAVPLPDPPAAKGSASTDEESSGEPS